MPRTPRPLSDTAIRQAKPGEKKRFLFDGQCLCLEIKPSGAKYWRFRYTYLKEQRMISLGAYPDLSLIDARKKREEYNSMLANGIDPLQHRRSTSSGDNTFESIAREWFLSFKNTWSEEHGERIIRRLERDVFPFLGKILIDDITSPTLLAVVKKIQNRGCLETAHRALTNCGQVFNYAIQTGRTNHDPVTALRRAIPPTPEKHLAAITDPEKLGAFLRAADDYKGGLIVGPALRLMPLVVVRPGELRNMEWSQIDFKTKEWRFTVSKTRREHVVPLCRQAIEILQGLHQVSGEFRFVFTNPKTPDGSRAMSENAVLSALRSMGYSKDEVTGHGFRASFRTIGAEVLNFKIELMEHQLAHTVRDPLGRAYNRTEFLLARKEMMQTWADYLDELKATV